MIGGVFTGKKLDTELFGSVRAVQSKETGADLTVSVPQIKFSKSAETSTENSQNDGDLPYTFDISQKFPERMQFLLQFLFSIEFYNRIQ